jgi:hypothetical protein
MHFCLLAITPVTVSDPRYLPAHDRMTEILTPLLAPFDEENEHDEEKYRPCWCVGKEAHDRAIQQVNAEMGSYQDGWMEWDSKHRPPSDSTGNLKQAMRDYYQLRETEGMKAVIEPRRARERELVLADPDRDKPMVDCPGCAGSGQIRGGGEWDWWVIGGRWTGALSGYDPGKDPNNIETCPLCEGTGKRTDALGEEMRRMAPDYTCNGCDGTGKRVKWPTQWGNHVGDITLCAAVRPDFEPHAVLTPTGEWIAHWFSSPLKGILAEVVAGDPERAAWREKLAELRAAYPYNVVAVVDCHT